MLNSLFSLSFRRQPKQKFHVFLLIFNSLKELYTVVVTQNICQTLTTSIYFLLVVWLLPHWSQKRKYFWENPPRGSSVRRILRINDESTVTGGGSAWLAWTLHTLSMALVRILGQIMHWLTAQRGYFDDKILKVIGHSVTDSHINILLSKVRNSMPNDILFFQV